MTDNITRSSLDFIIKQNARQRIKNSVVDVESPLIPKNPKNVRKLLWIHGKAEADIPQGRPKKPGVAVQNIEPPFQHVFGIRNSASSAWSTLSSNDARPRRGPSQRQSYKLSSSLLNVDKSFTVVDISLDDTPTNTVSPNIVFELKQIDEQPAHDFRRSYLSDCQKEQHRPSECIEHSPDAEIIENLEPVDGGLIVKSLRMIEDCVKEKTMATSSPESDQEEFEENEEFEITVLNGRKPEVKKFVL